MLWAEDIKWVRWQVWAKFALTTEPVLPDQDLDSFTMAECLISVIPGGSLLLTVFSGNSGVNDLFKPKHVFDQYWEDFYK